jgi:crotonobetainyl-CoA:carnitine CoA-transferase CaiB-like acyl-CoA transferase
VLHHNDLEDLISDWIQEDVEDMWSQRDEKARAVAEAQRKKREADRAEQAERDHMVLRAVQRPRTPLDAPPASPQPVKPAAPSPAPARVRANHGVHQPRHMPVG